MNKDKIIKDLKKRNDSLKMQYEYRNIRCISLERENQRLLEENQQLKKQKDDVVEYIKNNQYRQYAGRNEFTCEIQYTDYVIKTNDLLRMLGEIDE